MTVTKVEIPDNKFVRCSIYDITNIETFTAKRSYDKGKSYLNLDQKELAFLETNPEWVYAESYEAEDGVILARPAKAISVIRDSREFEQTLILDTKGATKLLFVTDH